MDIFKKIENGAYDSDKLVRPRQPSKRCICGQLCTAMPNFCPSCGAQFKSQYQVLFNEYTTLHDTYVKQRTALADQFKTDAFKHCGIADHKKKEIAYQMAVNMASNSTELVEYLEELAEIMS